MKTILKSTAKLLHSSVRALMAARVAATETPRLNKKNIGDGNMAKILVRDTEELISLLDILGIEIKVEIDPEAFDRLAINIQVWNARSKQLMQVRKFSVLEPIFIKNLESQNNFDRVLFIMRNRSRFISACNVATWGSDEAITKMDLEGFFELVGVDSISVCSFLYYRK